MNEVFTNLQQDGRGSYACVLCKGLTFKSSNHFLKHLREVHCIQEGGSFVCKYGQNNVCSSLPLEGVSDKDYAEHIIKNHVFKMLPNTSYDDAVKRRASMGSNAPEKWGVYSSTQNIPAVLTDPRKGMKRDFFTKTWGETFVEVKDVPTHVALPDISWRHFDSYLRKVKKRQKLLTKIATKESAKYEEAGGVRETCLSSPDCLSSDKEEIPAIFLSSSFNLEDPSTFYSVFAHITSSGVNKRKAKALQEKLFHFLETVESSMCRQIARKSSAFFETMTYLNAQMEQLQLNYNAATTLRRGVSKLKEEVVVEPMKILSLPQKRLNIVDACKKLEGMSTVREVQSTIQEMLARQEYSESLELIATTQDFLQSELTSIKCLRNLSSELTEHIKLIDKMVSAEFTKYITDDLNRPLEDRRPLLEEDQLIAVVFGVLRLQKFDFLDNFREEIYSAIKATVKQTVAESVSEVEIDQESHNVVEQAKVLPLHSWLSLLNTITLRLRIIIERVKLIIDVMVQAIEDCTGKCKSSLEGIQTASIALSSDDENNPMMGEATCTKLLSGLKEVLCSTCDYSHDRCAKLLHARSRDNALDKMTAKEFLSLSCIIERFVEDTEKVCGRKSTSFRMGLQGQASRFVSRFHEERTARMKLNLTSERWRAVQAPFDLQALLDHISNSGTLSFPPEETPHMNDTQVENLPKSASTCSLSSISSSASCSKIDGLNHPKSSSSIAHSISCATLTNGSASATDTTSSSMTGVVFGGEEYIIVGVCVVMVRIIVEYAECAFTLRLAAQQLLTRLMDLLRKFNADTCRLLVEAGAVSFGLKTITARHLGLAWRSLQLLLTLMPRMSEHFAALLKPSLVEKHIAQLTREYEEHCGAIQKKIVGVVSDSLDKHLKIWEAKSPVPSSAFNSILKSLSRLHEITMGVLSPNQVEALYERITATLKEKLQFHVVRLNVSSVGPQSWVVMSELTFYFNHLSGLGIKPSVTQEEFISDLWK